MILLTMLHDMIDRNNLPVDLSPYKARHDLAERNREHAEVMLEQARLLKVDMIEAAKTLSAAYEALDRPGVDPLMQRILRAATQLQRNAGVGL